MAQLEVCSPFDGHLITQVEQHSSKQADAMMQTAYQCFNDKSQALSPEQRRQILENALAIFKERKHELALTAASEGGKPLADSKIEVERAIQGIQVAIEHIPQLLGAEVPMNLTASSAHRIAYTFRCPVGVVLAISAFNHPVNLIVHQVIPAIACGCPVIVKPASATPLSCLNVVNILTEAGLPEGWCQALITTPTVVEKLVSDSRVSFLSFIGSAKVGWYLRSKLAAGAGCALEHGGAAPVILENDTNLEDAIPLLAKGGFYHAGQVCVSVQRIYAHNKIAKTVAKQLAEQASRLSVGDPTQEQTDVGPLIAKKEVKRVHEWVQQAIYHGAKCLTGGEPLSDTCYKPTVLLDPPHDVKLSTEEVFGPVVCVYSYKHLEHALEWANKPPFSFQAAVFTNQLNVAMKCVRDLHATAVMVNDHTAFRVDWMPFGGRRQSGMGTGGIPYSMHEMTYEKMFVVRHAPE